jgi:hypothetical protein
MGVVLAQDPGPGNTKMKINKSDNHTVKSTKGKELKPSRGKSAIYNLVPSEEKGWHHRSVLGEVTHEGWTFKESHTYEFKRHLIATSKSQASNMQDSLCYQLI